VQVEIDCLLKIDGRLSDEPARVGYYSNLLFVPAHATIQAHSHRDDRVATVVPGEWQFGYGAKFDEGSLKKLPPGSVYSEPKGENHFAYWKRCRSRADLWLRSDGHSICRSKE
jgi:hypothetical protein